MREGVSRPQTHTLSPDGHNFPAVLWGRRVKVVTAGPRVSAVHSRASQSGHCGGETEGGGVSTQDGPG